MKVKNVDPKTIETLKNVLLSFKQQNNQQDIDEAMERDLIAPIREVDPTLAEQLNTYVKATYEMRCALIRGLEARPELSAFRPN